LQFLLSACHAHFLGLGTSPVEKWLWSSIVRPVKSFQSLTNNDSRGSDIICHMGVIDSSCNPSVKKKKKKKKKTETL
jgi:hypothetical protein